MKTHYRTCNLCEAMCGIEIEVEGDRVMAIRGDKQDPFSQGHICPKAAALADIHQDPNRLKFPIRRTAQGWEQISWEEAFTEVVTNLRRIQSQYGNNAVGVYLGNPNVHHLGLIMYNTPFIRSLRTKNRFSATSVDQLPHHFAAYLMFGHQLLLPIPDIDRTDYLLMLGANPLASNGSIMTAPDIKGRLKKLQARGGKLVLIDPRRTETAAMANRHWFIRPNSDALFLLAIVHTLFAEGWVKAGHLTEITDGFERLEQLATDFSPEQVAGATGIPAEGIRQIARELVEAERSVVYGRIGVSTQKFGGLCQWLINTINLLTGNLDKEGGAMFTMPALDLVRIASFTKQTGHLGRQGSRVRQLPNFSGELPVAALAEEILTPGEGQIRAMVTVAGNPVLSTPNGSQLDKAFAQLEFMVAIDVAINETTRHAHIILPSTTGLETDHYDVVFHLFAVHNTAKFSPAVFEPQEGMLHDWQILQQLANRLEGIANPNRHSHKWDFLKRMSPQQLLDLGLRTGPYGSYGIFYDKRTQTSLTLSKLKKAPHGIDLGPLQPNLKQRLATPNRRIALAPDLLVADVTRLREYLPHLTTPSDSLWLIGRRDLRSNNSWMHNYQRLVKGKERCTLLMNPADAQSRCLADGQMVEVSSRVGCVQLPLEMTETMMSGVVSMPHGWGHGRAGTRLPIAQQHPGVSINDLTDEQQLDTLTGNAAFSGISVSVKAA